MGADVFDLEWVKATVKLFTLFGWGLFVAGTVVAVFDVAIEYQCGRANVKTTALNIHKRLLCLFSHRSRTDRIIQVLHQPAKHIFPRPCPDFCGNAVT